MIIRKNELEGCIDRVEDGWEFGWVWNSEKPNDPIEVDVFVDGERKASAWANLYRLDLETAGKGNGQHGFEVAIPEIAETGQARQIGVRFSGTQTRFAWYPPACLIHAENLHYTRDSRGSRYGPYDGRNFLEKDSHSLHVAVALNGTIRAVTQTYQQGSATRFTAMIPEEAFRPGKNHVEVFAILLENDGIPKLARLGEHRAIMYSLSTATVDGSEKITSPNGKNIQVLNNRPWGDRAIVKDGEINLVGWAADLTNVQLPEVILIFVDGEFFYSGGTNQNRPELARKYKNAALKSSAFHYTFPGRFFRRLDSAEIRIFALWQNGVASELQYFVGYLWCKKYSLIAAREGDGEVLTTSEVGKCRLFRGRCADA